MPTQNETNNLAKQKSWAIRRIFVGGVFGGALTFAAGYCWAALNNNLNPVAGLGLLLISSVGIVIGSLLALLSKKWRRNDF